MCSPLFFWHFKILDLGVLPPRSGLVVWDSSYDSMGMRVWCTFEFQKFSAIFNKIQAMSSIEHFLGPSGKNFSFFIFLQELFWATSLQIRSETFGEKFTKKITYVDSLWKNTQTQKKNRPNQSLVVGDIANLKSAMLQKYFWWQFIDDNSPIIFYNFCAEFQRKDCRSDLLLKNHPIKKKTIGWNEVRMREIPLI